MRSPITPAIVLKLDLEVSDDSEHFEKKKIPSKNESTSRNFSGDNCEEDIDECEERNQCLGINNEICSCFVFCDFHLIVKRENLKCISPTRINKTLILSRNNSYHPTS